MTMRHGTPAETPEQVIGAFLMLHGVAPWEADDLVRWLKEEGFKIERVADGESITKREE